MCPVEAPPTKARGGAIAIFVASVEEECEERVWKLVTRLVLDVDCGEEHSRTIKHYT